MGNNNSHSDRQNETKELHRIIIENINDPVIITDDNGRLTYICPNVIRALGFSADEIKKMGSVTECMGNTTPLFDPEELNRLGQIDNIETVIFNKNGRPLNLLVTVKKVDIQGGTTLYVCRDVTDLKQVELEVRSHIRFLESLEVIDQAIKQETDVEKMLLAIVEKMLDIFDCDRVWLLYPCDPDASSWRVPVECTRPEYPGAYETGVEIPMTPDVAQTFVELLKTDEPVHGVIKPGEAKWDQGDQFGVRSFLSTAVRPKIGKPWDLGLHQCSHPREWTADEIKLFKEVGRRLGDALTSVLSIRDLKESKELLSDTQKLAKIGGWAWYADTEKVIWTDQIYQILELPFDPEIDHYNDSMNLVDQAYQDPLAKAFEKAREEGIPYDLELKITTAKGNRRWIRTIANPVKRNGQVVKITGNLMDITETRTAQKEQEEYIQFLENMELIDLAIKQETDVELMLDNVLHTVFNIFECDRVWLLYPCDPSEPSFKIPVEVTRPEYPGGKELGLEIPMSSDQAQDLVDALSSKDPVSFTTETMRGLSKKTAEDYDVKTQMFIAIYPKLGKPWMFGMHQCSYARVWTPGEQKLFKAISRRIEDGLSSLLFLKDLRKSELKYKDIFNNLLDIYVETDMEGNIAEVSPSFEMISGYKREEVVGTPARHYYADSSQREEMLRRLEIIDVSSEFEVDMLHKDGSRVPVSMTSTLVRDENGEPIKLIGMAREITERKRAEQEKEKLQRQLVQAQKMESVGRLAGGVAHDFNNILNVILGYADMTLEAVEKDAQLYADLKEIKKAGLRAADLTRQLLAFARKQTVSPRTLDLNRAVDDMLSMVERLIGENIRLVWQPGTDLWQLRLDPSQIDQILANLCVNARDAIDGVGTISIETSNVLLDDIYCVDHPYVVPGEYVCLVVRDDGCGMSDRVRQNLFEPFFTTKKTGEGTGLGLSTVYGIIKQNEGVITVESEPEKGSVFRIYFPRYIGQKEEKKDARNDKDKHTDQGSEIILVVEDEPALLQLCTGMLKKFGYAVLEASTPGQAIAIAREYPGNIDLLITDVVMPEMNGRELCKQIQPLYPNMKRLFMSGYTSDIIAHHGVIEEGIQFLHKPFTMKDLKKKLRDILDEN